MKCEHCNNEMVWEGSLRGGHLVCQHCESISDSAYNLRVKEIYEAAMRPQAGGGNSSSHPIIGSGACSGSGGSSVTVGIDVIAADTPIDPSVWDYDI